MGRAIRRRKPVVRAVGSVRFHIEQLEERKLLTAVVAPPDPVIFGNTVTGPLAPNPGHSSYASSNTSTGAQISTWANDSAITPNTVNDLVLNVTAFSQSYQPCCDANNGIGVGTTGSINAGRLLTNGLTQNQVGDFPSAGQTAALGSGSTSDAASAMSVLSDSNDGSWWLAYNLGNYGNYNDSNFVPGATPSPTGYDISEIDVITGMSDFREAIGSVDVMVEPVGSSQFLSLSGSSGFSLINVPLPTTGIKFPTGGSVQMAIVNNVPGQPLAQNIQAIKFVALDSSTWFRELVVNGVTSGPVPGGPPAVPSNISASLGNAGFTVSWSPSSGAAGYSVLRSTAPGGTYTQVGSTLGQTSLVDQTAQPNTTYYYKVAASGDGDSAASAPSQGLALANFGANAYFFPGPSQPWQGTPSITETIPQVNYSGSYSSTAFPLANGFNSSLFSTFINGKITTDLAGTYTFVIATDDDGYLWVNGKLVSANPGSHFTQNPSTTVPISLAANTSYDFVFLENNRSFYWGMHMYWQEPMANGTAGPLTLVPATHVAPNADPAPVPSQLSAIAASDTQVELTWPSRGDASSYAYAIERATADSHGNPTSPFSVVAQDFSGLTTLNAAPLSWDPGVYVDQTVQPNTSYLYKIGPVSPGQTTPAAFSPISQVVTTSVQPAYTIVVNTTADTSGTAGVVSLRNAIAAANASPTPTDIVFDPNVFATPQRITLGGTLIFNNPLQPIRIVGPPEGVTIATNNLHNVFGITQGVVSLSGLSLTQSTGSAIYNYGVLRLSNVTISGVASASDFGAGIYNGIGGTLAATNTTISNNTTGGTYGAGIYNGGVMTLVDSTVSNNSLNGFGGGGIANNGVSMTLINDTIAGNSSSTYGGGIYNTSSATVINCTISGNTSSQYGGGIFDYYGGTITVANTIAASNISIVGFGPDVYNAAGALTSNGFNVIGIVDGASSGWISSDHTGTGASPLNAKLSSLGNYGGPTQTAPPQTGSPAIGSGSVALVPSGIVTDQRGRSRTLNNTVDIGAVETGVPAAVVAPPDPVIWGGTLTGPLSPKPGHSLYAAAITAQGVAAPEAPWGNVSAITPNTLNDLVLNVLPQKTNYVPTTAVVGGSVNVLTNGITQTQTAPSPGPGLPAVGDGQANDPSGKTNVIAEPSGFSGFPVYFIYQLGTANGAAPSATGYDITEVDLITGQSDWRAAINSVDVLVQPVGSNQFISLSDGRGFTLTSAPDGNGGSVAIVKGGSAQMAIVSTTPGQPLATNIQAVKLIISPIVTNQVTYLREFVVTGSASALLPPAIQSPSAVSVSFAGAANTLVWNPVPNATGYVVLRSTSASGGYSPIGTLSDQTSFIDNSIAPNTTYYYQVIASGYGDSTPTAPVSVSVPAFSTAAIVVPPDPLIWGNTISASLPPEPGHSFYVAGDYPNSTPWLDNSAITPNTVNDLVLNVTAFSQNYTPSFEGSNSAPGNTSSINSGRLLTNGLTQNQIGNFPSSGQTAATGSGFISDSSSGASVLSETATAAWWLEYNLGNYGNYNGSSFIAGATPSTTGYDISEIDVITGHQDTRVGMQMDLMVEAVGSNQWYSLSNGQDFTFTNSPDGSGGTIELVRGSAQMAIVSGTPGQPLATNIAALKFVAANNQTWFRELVVTGAASASLPSSAAPPTGVTASLTPGPVSVTWNSSPGAVGYTVWRSTSSTGPWTIVGTAVGQNSFTDSGLTVNAGAPPNTTYYYAVSASVNGDSGLSPPSNPVTTPNFGASAYIFQSQLWQGTPAITEQMPEINYNGVNTSTAFPLAPGFNANAFSTFIEGKVTTDLAGTYFFGANTDDDGYLYVNGQLVSGNVGGHVQQNATMTLPISLAANTAYNFVFLEDNNAGNWGFQMYWQEPTANGLPGLLTLVPETHLSPAADIAPPPQTVTASLLSDTAVRLSWSPHADTTSFAYVIQRAPADSNGNPTGAFFQVAQVFSGPASLAGATATAGSASPSWGISSFDDSTAAPNSRYVYRVGLLMPGQTSTTTFSPLSQPVTTGASATATLSAGVLNVTMGAYDVINLSLDGSGNLLVNEGTTNIFITPAAGVSSLVIQGTTGLPGTVNLNGVLSFSGPVSITQVSDVTIAAGLTAQRLTISASNNITLNASVTTSGPVSISADNDENGLGTLLIASGTTLNSSNNPISLHASTFTQSGSINAGTGSVTCSFSSSFSATVGTIVTSSVLTLSQTVNTSVSWATTWGSGVTGTIILNFPAAALSTTGLNSSAGNANLQIVASSFTSTGAINTGTGSLTINAPTSTIGSPVTAGLITVPAGDAVTLNSSMTANGSMTIAGSVIVNSNVLTVFNGLSLSNGGTVNLNSTPSAQASLVMANTETLGGQGSVIFNGSLPTNAANVRVGQSGQPATLTIAPLVSITTATGSGVIGSGIAGNLIVNQGTISAAGPGTSVSIVDALQGNAPTGSVSTLNSATWTGFGDGLSWIDPNNWSGGQLPGPSTDVTINTASSTTINIPSGVQSVRSLTSNDPITITGGELDVAAASQAPSITLSGSAVLGGIGSWTVTNLTMQDTCTVNGGNTTVTGALTWTGGTMSGTGITTIPSSATLAISGDLGAGHTPSQGVTLARTLNTSSTSATWSGNLNISFNNGVFNNLGTFTVTGDSGVTMTATGTGSNSTGIFINSGTLNYSGPSSFLWFNATTNGVTFNNSGTVNVTAGQLILDHGGTISGPMHFTAPGSALFRSSLTFAGGGSVSGTGAVTLNAGTYTFASGQFTPTGAVNFTAGTITINNSISPSSLGNIGAAVTFNGSINNATAATILSTGNVTLGNGASWSPASLANAGALNVNPGATLTVAGALSGTGNVTIGAPTGNVSASLTAGSFAQTNVTINPAGTLAVAANSNPVANSATTLSIASGGTLSLIPTATLTLPATSTALSLNGGRIVSGTLLSSGSFLNDSGTAIFDGVTLGTTLNLNSGTLTVLDGLTLVNSAFLNLNSNPIVPATLTFANSQTLGGSGLVIFNANSPTTFGNLYIGSGTQSATLTIAPGVSIITGSGSGSIGSSIAGNQIINQGTISAQTAGAAIVFLDPLQNQGAGAATQSNGGLLITPVVWTGGGDGTSWTDPLNWSGGILPTSSNSAIINLNSNPTITIASGTQSAYYLLSSDPIQITGGTLAITNQAQIASLTLAGGTISGGPYLALNGALNPLSVSTTGTLDGVTLNVPLTLGANSLLHVKDGLTLNSTLTLSGNLNGTGPATLEIDGSQSILGQGQIVFNGDVPATVSQIFIGQPGQSATLTIGPSVAISTGSGSGIIGSGTAGNQIINQGSISAKTAGASITVLDPLTNQGAGTATQSNGGSLNLNTGGALAFTGGTVNLASSLGDVSAIVVSGGSLNLTSQSPVTLPAVTLSGGTLSSTTPITVTATATLSGGTISGAGGLVIPTGATATVSGAVIATAPLTDSGTINVASGSLELDGGGTQSGTFNVSTGSALAFGGNTTQTLTTNSSITGSGIVQFTGTDVVTISGTYNVGSTVVLGGATVTLPDSATTGTLTLLGGTLNIGPQSGGGGALPAIGTIHPAATTNTVTVSQEVMDGGVLNVQAGWTLSNTGATLFGAGSTINVASDNASPAVLMMGGDIFFTSSSGTAFINSTGTGTKAGVVDMGGVTRSFTVNAGSAPIDLSISASLTDGGIRLSGGGWMQLLGSNTYALGTTVVGGTLETDTASALGTGPLVFSGGTLAPRGTTVFSSPLTAAPTASISLDVGSATVQVPGATLGIALNVTGNGGLLQITGPVTLQGDITVNNSAGLEISGPISGQGTISKTLSGTLTLDGSSANNYGGQTIVYGGTLVLNKSAGTLAVPGDLTINGPGIVRLLSSQQLASTASVHFNSVPGLAVLDLNGQSQTLSQISDTAGGSILTGGGTLTLGGTNASSTFAGAISGGGSLIKSGSGGLALTGTNGFTGALAVNAGSLQLNSFNQTSITIGPSAILSIPRSVTPSINRTSSLTISPGGKLDMSNSTMLISYGGQADPIATIRSYLAGGFNNGSWNGSGINSSAAAINAAQTTAIGYADSADGLIAGQPANTIELKYTLYGDTGLSTSVGFNDFTRLTQHYNQTSGGAWDTGDFNYDGSVNFSDFTLMTRTYNTGLGSQASPATSAAAAVAGSAASKPSTPAASATPTGTSAQPSTAVPTAAKSVPTATVNVSSGHATRPHSTTQRHSKKRHKGR